jgi:serine/threonine protein kinase
MGKLDNPYCIKVLEFIKNEKFFYIIQEYANGCSLLDLLNERYR